MAEVAFATYHKSPDVTDDDRLAADALRCKGVTVTSAIWSAPDIDWSRFDAVIIRSTWDYHLMPEQFTAWLRRCAQAGIRLWNKPDVVLRNMDKRYLSALADSGVAVVPTMSLASSQELSLRNVLENSNWKDVVIKPAISAAAFGTWRTSLETAETDQTRFAEQLRSRDLLVQPYFPEIGFRGEWSLVFFGGHYSHAVLKQPARDDFRVQREFGGTSVSAFPAAALIHDAEFALSAIGQELLYARVDGIEQDGRLILMELEMIEPYLFLSSSSLAAERFAHAILRVLDGFGSA
jgi:glutathione synthase/RimK-type ligase-like ATP-grasp enzyme